MADASRPNEPGRPTESVPVRTGGCPTASGLTRSVESADLFGGAKTVLINHRGEQYRLLVTKSGKLLLQK